jgi:hypothetical protein
MKVTRFYFVRSMMSVEQAIKSAMLVMLRNRGLSAIEVTAYEEEERSMGYCDTCYSEYTVVMISYITETGVQSRFEYYGGFAELIRELEASS